jgi:hypothetical protein
MFIHVYTIFPPYSPSYTLSLYPPRHWYQPPRQYLFYLPVLQFEKRHFSLFKIFVQSFIKTLPCTYVLYHKLVHLHFSPVSFSRPFMVISTGLKILYSFLHRKYITNIHILYFLSLNSPLLFVPSFVLV